MFCGHVLVNRFLYSLFTLLSSACPSWGPALDHCPFPRIHIVGINFFGGWAGRAPCTAFLSSTLWVDLLTKDASGFSWWASPCSRLLWFGPFHFGPPHCSSRGMPRHFPCRRGFPSFPLRSSPSASAFTAVAFHLFRIWSSHGSSGAWSSALLRPSHASVTCLVSGHPVPALDGASLCVKIFHLVVGVCPVLQL